MGLPRQVISLNRSLRNRSITSLTDVIFCSARFHKITIKKLSTPIIVKIGGYKFGHEMGGIRI